jgi:hypothetical protein
MNLVQIIFYAAKLYKKLIIISVLKFAYNPT